MLDAGVQYPEMVNGRKGIYVHSLKYETIIDNDIKRRRQFAEEMREKAGPSPLAVKLKSVGLI